MKKLFIILIFIFSLVSCNKVEDINNDIIYDQMVINDKYLKSEATCFSKAIYYYCSIDGLIGSNTFEYGDFASHRVVSNVCVWCNTYIDNIEWGPLH